MRPLRLAQLVDEPQIGADDRRAFLCLVWPVRPADLVAESHQFSRDRCHTRPMKLREWVTAPPVLRSFHGWLTVAWAGAIPLTIFTSMKTSLLWIGAMSAWANFAGHFSAWQAARVEVTMADGGDPAVRAAVVDE